MDCVACTNNLVDKVDKINKTQGSDFIPQRNMCWFSVCRTFLHPLALNFVAPLLKTVHGQVGGEETISNLLFTKHFQINKIISRLLGKGRNIFMFEFHNQQTTKDKKLADF